MSFLYPVVGYDYAHKLNNPCFQIPFLSTYNFLTLNAKLFKFLMQNIIRVAWFHVKSLLTIRTIPNGGAQQPHSRALHNTRLIKRRFN